MGFQAGTAAFTISDLDGFVHLTAGEYTIKVAKPLTPENIDVGVALLVDAVTGNLPHRVTMALVKKGMEA